MNLIQLWCERMNLNLLNSNAIQTRIIGKKWNIILFDESIQADFRGSLKNDKHRFRINAEIKK